MEVMGRGYQKLPNNGDNHQQRSQLLFPGVGQAVVRGSSVGAIEGIWTLGGKLKQVS